MESRNTLILVNPKARGGDAGTNWKELEKQLLEALGEDSAQVVFTSAEDHGSGAVRDALKKGIRKVVVVGGDGTVSEAVQGFFENGEAISPEACLIVMPAGRGDDFFKSIVGHRMLSSRGAWEEGLALIRNGRSLPADLGRVEWLSGGGRYFINVVSFGYPGLVVQKVLSRTGIFGKSRAGKSAWTYLIHSATGVLEYRPVRAEIKIDGEIVFDAPVFSGFVLNGRYNGGGICWNKDARIDDGLFHVVVSEPQKPFFSLLNAPRMLSGDWDVKGIHVRSGKRIEIRPLEEPRGGHPFFEVDGDQTEDLLREGNKGAVFEMMAGKIRIRR